MVHLAYFVQINWIIYIDYVQLDSSIIIHNTLASIICSNSGDVHTQHYNRPSCFRQEGFVNEKKLPTTNSRILIFQDISLQKLVLKLGQRKVEGRKIFKVSLNHELSPVFSGNEWPLFFSPRCGNIVADVLDLRVSGKHLTFPPSSLPLFRSCTSKRRSSKYRVNRVQGTR